MVPRWLQNYKLYKIECDTICATCVRDSILAGQTGLMSNKYAMYNFIRYEDRRSCVAFSMLMIACLSKGKLCHDLRTLPTNVYDSCSRVYLEP